MSPAHTIAALRTRLLALSALAALIPAVASAAGPSGHWTQFIQPAGPALPSGRVYSSSIYDPNSSSLMIFGGYPLAQSDVWKFPLSASGPWTQQTPSGGIPGRWGHAAIYDPIRNRMIVVGGFDNSTQFNTVYEYKLSGPPAWMQILPAGTPPAPRRNHFLVYDPARDRVLMFGGVSEGSPLTFWNDLWALNLSGPPVWTQLTPAGTPPTGRSMVEAVYDPVADRLVIFGGWDGFNYLDELWELQLSGTPTWAPLAATGTPPSPRRDGGAILDAANSRMILFGGLDGSTGLLNDTWTLSLSGTPQWSILPTLGTAPSGRSSFATSLDLPNNRLVIFGGYNGPADVNEIWSLSLGAGTETWTNLFTPPPPTPIAPPNCDYAMAYDQGRDRAVYFGGKRNGAFNETWIWQLGGTPGFSQLLTGNHPSARYSSSAVFDVPNDRMLMFGGYDGNYLNDVWSLNFTGTPDWTPVAALGPYPQARLYNSAITDPVRQRLVIFGGNPVELNDTWVLPFNAPPQWSQLAPAGTIPPARWGHNAVYDPLRDRMIVFGGFGGSINRNDVWALQFTPTLQWVQLLPPDPLPGGRRNATMVYDSSRDRMLLFGGYAESSGFLNDVWELALTPTPKWTQLTPTGILPEQRNQMMAVYEPFMDRVAVYAGWDFHLLGDSWFLGFDQPTAALVSLVRAVATDAGVELSWQIGEGSDPPLAIERSTGGFSWSAITPAGIDGGGRVDFTDSAAPNANRIGYRLAFASSHEGEVWVDVPARSPFAIRSIGPNPATNRVLLALSLSEHRAARIDVVDLAGRRVLSHDLGVLEAGSRQVSLDGLGALPAGLYLVRLTAGAQVATSRLMVVR